MSSKSASLPENRDENEPSMEEILASIRKIIADDSLGMKKDEPVAKKQPVAKKEPEPAPAPEPEPEPVVEEEPEILDLAEVATVAAPPAPPAPPVMAEPEPMPPMMMEPPAPVVPKAPVNNVAALEERIVSDNTGVLVGQAFQTLARHTAMPAIGRSIEDVITEILRPMLRDWMDQHLAGIVEKLVKAEIERVARG